MSKQSLWSTRDLVLTAARPLGTLLGLAGPCLLVVTLLAGCRGEGPPAGVTASPPEPGTVVAVSSIDMRDVNELTAETTAVHTMLHYFALFLPLLDEQANFQEGPPTFEPQLAESWEFSPDRLTLTMHLRPNVVWSDGVPVTAEDVRWTWQAQTDPDVGWYLSEVKRHIRDVEVVDEHTVRFHFDEASGTQLLDANLGVILPKHAWSRLPFSQWRQNADWFRENLVVDGPFTLESWEPQQRFVLRRNERYFRGPELPRAERIVFRVVSERTSGLALLRSGEAQIVDWARPGDAIELAREPEIEIKSYPIRGFAALVYNLEKPLFRASAVRRALTLAIDRQAVVDAFYHGYAQVSVSPYTANIWAFNREIEPLPYDPQRAREILAAEGWSDHDGDGVLDKDGLAFRFEILTPGGNELRQDILTMIQEQLEKVGIEAHQRVIEANTQVVRERAHDFDASFDGWGIPTNLDLTTFFHSNSIAEGYNFGQYSNPEVDRLLDEIRGQLDQVGAKPLYDRLQVLIHEDQPYTFLYEPIRLVPIRKSLQGVEPNVISTFYGLEKGRNAAPAPR